MIGLGGRHAVLFSFRCGEEVGAAIANSFSEFHIRKFAPSHPHRWTYETGKTSVSTASYGFRDQVPSKMPFPE